MRVVKYARTADEMIIHIDYREPGDLPGLLLVDVGGLVSLAMGIFVPFRQYDSKLDSAFAIVWRGGMLLFGGLFVCGAAYGLQRWIFSRRTVLFHHGNQTVTVANKTLLASDTASNALSDYRTLAIGVEKRGHRVRRRVYTVQLKGSDDRIQDLFETEDERDAKEVVDEISKLTTFPIAPPEKAIT